MTNYNFYSFKNFLSITEGKKEIGLLVAKDYSELETFQKELTELGYFNSKNLKDLILNKKTFFHITHKSDESCIRYIKEYSTGAIQLISKSTKKFKWFYPEYRKSQLLLICTESEYEEFNENNSNLLNYVAVVYRNLEVNAK
jgi:hypothetical protein